MVDDSPKTLAREDKVTHSTQNEILVGVPRLNELGEEGKQENDSTVTFKDSRI